MRFLHMKVTRAMVAETSDSVTDTLWLVSRSFYYSTPTVNWLCINAGDLSSFYLSYFYKKSWSRKCHIGIDDGFCKIWTSFVLFDIHERRHVNSHHFESPPLHDSCVWVFWCWDHSCSIGPAANLIRRYLERDRTLENVFAVTAWCVLEKNSARTQHGEDVSRTTCDGVLGSHAEGTAGGHRDCPEAASHGSSAEEASLPLSPWHYHGGNSSINSISFSLCSHSIVIRDELDVNLGGTSTDEGKERIERKKR